MWIVVGIIVIIVVISFVNSQQQNKATQNHHISEDGLRESFPVLTKDFDSKNPKSKIVDLINIGIDFNWDFLGDKESGILFDLHHYSTDNNIEYWLVLREIGGQFLYFSDGIHHSVPYSKNVSTIVYEDHLFDNKLSSLFEEFNRITGGKIEFQVIDEFNQAYDSEGKENDSEFWNHSDYVKGKKNYLCKYIVNGKYLEIEYCFFDFSPKKLNGEFVIRLIKALKELLSENDISFIYPEEFITFFICDKQFRPKMKEYLGEYFEGNSNERKQFLNF